VNIYHLLKNNRVFIYLFSSPKNVCTPRQQVAPGLDCEAVRVAAALACRVHWGCPRAAPCRHRVCAGRLGAGVLVSMAPSGARRWRCDSRARALLHACSLHAIPPCVFAHACAWAPGAVRPLRARRRTNAVGPERAVCLALTCCCASLLVRAGGGGQRHLLGAQVCSPPRL
jgi:hypothetical protein